MSPVDTCPFCPRLCRHVCPVTVATARESATPTAIWSVVRLAERGQLEAELAEAALELCNGCGACARHCGVGVDVPSAVRECRSRPSPAALPELPAKGRIVRVEVDGEPGPERVISADALGHAAVKAGDAAHLDRLARHFAGWTVHTGSNAVAEVLAEAVRRAGAAAKGLRVVPDAAPATQPRFVTCWEGANGADGQIACCGAREGFEGRQPAVAGAMATEAVRRMGGRRHGCADSHCATWLRAHGGDVEGPDAH